MKSLAKKIPILFTILIAFIVASCSKQLKNQELGMVVVCTSLADYQTFEKVTSKDCLDYLLSIEKPYNLNAFYEAGGFTMILADPKNPHKKKLIQKFIDLGADINKLNPAPSAQGANALHSAVLFSDPEMVKFLLSKGARVDIKTTDGKSALELANHVYNRNKSTKRAEVIRLLTDTEK